MNGEKKKRIEERIGRTEIRVGPKGLAREKEWVPKWDGTFGEGFFQERPEYRRIPQQIPVEKSAPQD